ncbi:hypothetical protein [Streptomyces sp. NPDC056938]|uniref:hypothetical protein n=1 Tax=unclassified Streptomyces TaxID=2593676 RepID=UPI00363DC820
MGIFGSPGGFQIVVLEYMPLRRFGLFQILLNGWPIGDGSTTAFYPHYCDLQDLARLAECREPHERYRLSLGDTFDHMQVDAEMTNRAILFRFRSHDENSPWHEAQVDKREFLTVWRQAAACIEAILAQANES